MPNEIFTAVVRKEDDHHMARCPELGTEAQGKTQAEALKNLRTATELFLKGCVVEPLEVNVRRIETPWNEGAPSL